MQEVCDGQQQAEGVPEDVGVLIGKGLDPMYIFEVPWFAKMILHYTQS